MQSLKICWSNGRSNEEKMLAIDIITALLKVAVKYTFVIALALIRRLVVLRDSSTLGFFFRTFIRSVMFSGFV
jgi:hypothetical protein